MGLKSQKQLKKKSVYLQTQTTRKQPPQFENTVQQENKRFSYNHPLASTLKIKFSDSKSLAREQLIQTIQNRDQYVNQKAKQMQNEIYNQRYAIKTYSKSKVNVT